MTTKEYNEELDKEILRKNQQKYPSKYEQDQLAKQAAIHNQ